ncbi:MAG: lipocalin-like domain-containing protein, partial [Acidobacteriota bacterium]
LLGVAALALSGCAERASSREADDDRSPVALLAGEDDIDGYARADAPRPFVYPDDHGPHPDYKIEWWYLTGHLDADDGHRYGYQFTIFRSALTPPTETSDKTAAHDETTATDEATPDGSAWTTNQIYLAHVALTDLDGTGRHHAFERLGRGAVGVAGATAAPFRVWLDDWTLESANADPARDRSTPDGVFPVRLRAAIGAADLDLRTGEDDLAPFTLDLVLDAGKPAVLQGDRGLSRKGPTPGNASYYLSFTRMPTRGTVTIAGETRSVVGDSWLDREWSTSVLETHTVGWDWFALQLDDGREIMVYQLRRDDGVVDPWSGGVLTVVEADGSKRVHETQADGTASFLLEETGARWTSPTSDITYPAGWRLRVDDEALDLTLTPKLADQELNVTYRYWEGALDVAGIADGQPIGGRAYAELVGYRSGDD